MSTLKLILLLAVISLVYSGCERIVYIKASCPKLQTVDLNTTGLEPLMLHYRIKEVEDEK